MQPKLRDYVFYAPTNDGVLFRSLEGETILRGSDMYRWVERLIPYLNGTYTLEMICKGLDGQRQAVVRSLIQKLVEVGLVRDVEQDNVTSFSNQEVRCYASSLAYLEQYHTTPWQAFTRLRQAAVFAAGEGSAYLAAIQALLEMGIARLYTWTASEHTAQRLQKITTRFLTQEALREWRMLDALEPSSIPASSTVSFYLCESYCDWQAQQFLERCQRAQIPFLTGGIIENQLFIGPLVKPGQIGCTRCALVRLDRGQDREENSFGPAIFPGPAHTSALGYVLAYWLFCHITELPPPDKGQGLLRMDLDTFTTQSHPLLPWPSCPCSLKREASSEESGQQTKTHEQSRTRFTEKVQRVVDEYSGILSRVTEGTFDQMPICQVRATVRGLAGTNLSEIDLVIPARTAELAHYFARRASLAVYTQMLTPLPQDLQSLSPEQVHGGRKASCVFVTGQTYWEWVGTGLLEITRRLAWTAVLFNDPRGLRIQNISVHDGLVPYRKMLAIRFGMPVDALLLSHPQQPPNTYIVLLRSQETLLDIAVDVDLTEALERSLIRVLQQAHNASQQNQSSLDFLSALKLGILHDFPSPEKEWMRWSKVVIEHYKQRGADVLIRPVLSEPALEEIGLFTGYIGITFPSARELLPDLGSSL